jgi:NAD(P)H-hydrate epimerase
LEVAEDVGLTACPAVSDLNWVTPADFGGLPPRRGDSAHKGNFGHLLVLAGSHGFHGAAVLATRGAQRGQPGLVTLVTPKDVYPPVAAQLQSAMVRSWTASEPFVPDQCSAVLIGPGLAARELPQEMQLFTSRLWREAPGAVIIDASALDWLEPEVRPASGIRVLTPHPGEAARLLGCDSVRIQADRPAALRQLSVRFGNAWVVLKGQHTLIGRGDGEILVNSTGNPHLAQGGSGDVLAGFISGLLAQPAWQAQPQRAIAYAVWQHGATADVLARVQPNWTIEDLVAAIGNTPQDG